MRCANGIAAFGPNYLIGCRSTEKTFPGFDIVKLKIVSDGKQITVVTTLKSPPAEVASDVVELYFDLRTLGASNSSVNSARAWC